ncbi:hypothetical protein MCERE19_03417 [Spirosomataceae bacterium]|jgi:hypothetical protein
MKNTKIKSTSEFKLKVSLGVLSEIQTLTE